MQRSILWRWAAALTLLLPAACAHPDSAGPNSVDPNSWEQSSANAPGNNPMLTREFETTTAHGHMADNLTKSVADVKIPYIEFNGIRLISPSIGSAVLLDRFGTISMRAHQSMVILDNTIQLFFSDPKTGTQRMFNAEVEFVDKGMDIAFATIKDPSFKGALEKDWVRPLKWGQTRFGKDLEGRTLVTSGFPGIQGEVLHATRLTFERFVEYDETALFGVIGCQIRTEGKAYGGMSGGVVTDEENGDQFFGTLKGGRIFSNFSGYADFTPSEAIFNSYAMHYQDRALSNPFPDFNKQSLPTSCVDHAVSFRLPSSSRPLEMLLNPNGGGVRSNVVAPGVR